MKLPYATTGPTGLPFDFHGQPNSRVWQQLLYLATTSSIQLRATQTSNKQRRRSSNFRHIWRHSYPLTMYECCNAPRSSKKQQTHATTQQLSYDGAYPHPETNLFIEDVPLKRARQKGLYIIHHTNIKALKRNNFSLFPNNECIFQHWNIIWQLQYISHIFPNFHPLLLTEFCCIYIGWSLDASCAMHSL